MPLTEIEARDIASDWHGGQSSALYSFASTGKVWSEEHRNNLLVEIALCTIEANTFTSDIERNNLKNLADCIKGLEINNG